MADKKSSKSAKADKPKADKPKAAPVAAATGSTGSVNIGTCVLTGERDQLTEIAAKAGQSLSAFIRSATFSQAKLDGANRRPGRPRTKTA